MGHTEVSRAPSPFNLSHPLSLPHSPNGARPTSEGLQAKSPFELGVRRPPSLGATGHALVPAVEDLEHVIELQHLLALALAEVVPALAAGGIMYQLGVEIGSLCA